MAGMAGVIVAPRSASAIFVLNACSSSIAHAKNDTGRHLDTMKAVICAAQAFML